MVMLLKNLCLLYGHKTNFQLQLFVFDFSSIYAGVSLLKGPFDAVIEVKTCWATPSPDRNDAKRFTLIGD